MRKKTDIPAPTKAPTPERPQTPTGWPPRGLSFEDRPGRPKPYMARWREPGGRKRAQGFDSTRDRDAFARAWQRRRQTWGAAATIVHPTTVEAWKLFDELTGSADPVEVARFWIAHRNERGGSMTVEEARDRFLQLRAGRTISSDSASHLALHLRRLIGYLGTRTLAEVRPEDIQAWLDAMTAPKAPAWCAHRRAWVPMEPYTLKHHFRSAQLLFGHAVAARWTDFDPTATLTPPQETPTDVQVLTLTEARQLFAANRTALIIGRLALEAFAGLRFTSAARMHRAEILHSERGLILPGAKHKTGRRHYVDGYPENLWRWLEHAPDAGWDVTPRQYLDLKAEAFARAQVANPGNVLRHSFCSYHIAQHKDAARTAVLLTHRSPSMLYQHYKGRASQADAAAYFEISP